MNENVANFYFTSNSNRDDLDQSSEKLGNLGTKLSETF